MFQKSHEFFGGILENIGAILSPFKMVLSFAYGLFFVGLIIAMIFGVASPRLVTIWLWMLPFGGGFAVIALLGYFGIVSIDQEDDEEDTDDVAPDGLPETPAPDSTAARRQNLSRSQIKKQLKRRQGLK